jgi:hypothetical protein
LLVVVQIIAEEQERRNTIEKTTISNSRPEEVAIEQPMAGAVAEWAGTDLVVFSGGGIRGMSRCRRRLWRRPGGCLPLF